VACLFYWWEPDPTFLLLDPTEMTFPAHLKQEWSQGIQTSAGQQARGPIEAGHPLKASGVGHQLENI